MALDVSEGVLPPLYLFPFINNFLLFLIGKKGKRKYQVEMLLHFGSSWGCVMRGCGSEEGVGNSGSHILNSF